MTRSRWFHGLLAVIVVIVLLLVVYLAVRIQTIYQNTVEVYRLQAEVRELQKQIELKEKEYATRIEDLESLLYVDVVTDLDTVKRRPGSEAWQRNRDSELRKRINALERWRMRVEGGIGR